MYVLNDLSCLIGCKQKPFPKIVAALALLVFVLAFLAGPYHLSLPLEQPR